MTKYLMLISIAITFIAILLIKNINNKKVRYAILISPFVLASILYLGIIYISKTMPPDACDGAVLMGMILLFLLLGMGIVLNVVNLLHSILKRN